jgi:hypothetical protein
MTPNPKSPADKELELDLVILETMNSPAAQKGAEWIQLLRQELGLTPMSTEEIKRHIAIKVHSEVPMQDTEDNMDFSG